MCWHMAGKYDAVADALSRLEVHVVADVPTIDIEAMVVAQENKVEVQHMRSSRPVLQLQNTPLF